MEFFSDIREFHHDPLASKTRCGRGSKADNSVFAVTFPSLEDVRKDKSESGYGVKYICR